MNERRKPVLILVLCIAAILTATVSLKLKGGHAQITTPATTGMIAQIASFAGPPVGFLTCNAASANIPAEDSTTRNLWYCDGTQWWMLSGQPPDLTATGTIPAATVVIAGCSSAGTINVTGAVVGKRVDVQNSDGSLPPATTVYQGSVTAAGVVSVRQCAFVGLVMASKAVNVTVGQ